MPEIDLTMPLNPATPVYPGDPRVEVTITATLERDGYLDHMLKLGVHNGTHIDAPAHMTEDGQLLNEFPLNIFIGRGVLIDARSGLDQAVVAAANIQAQDIVLLWTGFSSAFKDPAYYSQTPLISAEAVQYLIDQQVKMVGIDAGSIDAEPFPVHKTLLKAGILIIENLVNLSQLEHKPFRIIALPLNLETEGAPARVVAEILD